VNLGLLGLPLLGLFGLRAAESAVGQFLQESSTDEFLDGSIDWRPAAAVVPSDC
jgi:hypothetical protein